MTGRPVVDMDSVPITINGAIELGGVIAFKDNNEVVYTLVGVELDVYTVKWAFASFRFEGQCMYVTESSQDTIGAAVHNKEEVRFFENVSEFEDWI